MSVCSICKVRPRRKHFNAIYCAPCAKARAARPRHNLTPEQQSYVRRMRGKASIREIADGLGISRTQVSRFRMHAGISLSTQAWRTNPTFVQEVCEYYAKYGKGPTLKRYPGIKIRSIVERYAHEPRQIRWTGEQLRELAQMAGIISMQSQARYFDRPNTHAGAIKSAWVKKFGNPGGQINGVTWRFGRHLVTRHCRPTVLPLWNARRGTRQKDRRLILWVDLARHMRPDLPREMKRAIRATAKLQRWLQGADDVKSKVRRLVRDREISWQMTFKKRTQGSPKSTTPEKFSTN